MVYSNLKNKIIICVTAYIHCFISWCVLKHKKHFGFSERTIKKVAESHITPSAISHFNLLFHYGVHRGTRSKIT